MSNQNRVIEVKIPTDGKPSFLAIGFDKGTVKLHYSESEARLLYAELGKLFGEGKKEAKPDIHSGIWYTGKL